MNKKNICIITFPISKAGITPLSNLIDILRPLSNYLYLISGNDGYESFKDSKVIQTYGVYHKESKNIFIRILRYITTQLKICYFIFRLKNKVDIFILFIGGEGLTLPILTLRLLHKKVMLALAGYTVGFAKDILSLSLKPFMKINLFLTDKIILHSEVLIDEWSLDQYRKNICIGHEYFINFDEFKIYTQYDQRENIVGYIGRLTEEKGIMNFVKAIPQILNRNKELKFLICGDGPFYTQIREYLEANELNDRVSLKGWISHNEVSKYLNIMKLLVIPSYTESGPIIALESMACGTPIVATKVGQVLNMIQDGKDGFIMENNSPECIAKNVLRAIDYPNCENVILNALNLLKSEYTFEVALTRYKSILSNSC